MMDLAHWLAELKPWFINRKPTSKVYRTDLGATDGLIEIGFNSGPQSFTAAYSIKNDDFDKIVHGKKMRTGGIITVQCGQISERFQQKIGYVDNDDSLDAFVNAIASEAPLFFDMFPRLENVFEALTSPTYLQANFFPHAESQRQMFAAVVAFLLGRPWRPHIDCAIKSLKTGISPDWIKGVEARLLILEGHA